jgi:hypothetical protein
MAKPRDRTPPTGPYGPPTRRLGPCPACHSTVLAAHWEERKGADPQPSGELWSPVVGEPHDCAAALIRNAAHWQYAVRLATPRRFPSEEGPHV